MAVGKLRLLGSMIGLAGLALGLAGPAQGLGDAPAQDPALGPAAATAPQAPKNAQVVEGLAVFQDWKKLCETAPDKKIRVCYGFQKVSHDVTKAQLLQVVVGYFRSGTADPTLIVTVPLGAYLLPGLEIRTAKKPIKADFQYCFSNGCQAAIRLDSARLALLTGMTEAEVVFLDAGHQRLSVPLSLKGFSDVLKALKDGDKAH